MNKNNLIYGLIAVLLVVTFCAGIFTHQRWLNCGQPQQLQDTVYIYKTADVVNPVPKETAQAPEEVPPVVIPKREILSAEDTAVVAVRPEITTYRDTLPSGASYALTLSGVGAKIEKFKMSWPESVTTVVQDRRGWEMALVGRGVLSGFRPEYMRASVGIEFGYTSGRFSFGIGPGVEWSRRPGEYSHHPHLCVTASVRIRLCSFR